MRTPKLAAATLLGATALASIAAIEPTDPATVDITGLTAAVVDGDLDVAGELDFGGLFDAGSDISDPNQQGKLPGTNFTGATVSQTGPFIEFTINVDNMVPADPYSAPESLQYGWDLIDGNGSPVSLSAFRTAVAQTASEDAYFVINTCSPDPDTGQNTCSGTESDGEFTADGLTWRTSTAQIGRAGSTLTLSSGEGPVHVTPGASGLIWFSGGGALDLDNFNAFGDFVIGGKVTVTVTDASGAVVAAKSVDQFQPGAFDASIDVSGLSAGDYTVTATSRYADQSDSESTVITLG